MPLVAKTTRGTKTIVEVTFLEEEEGADALADALSQQFGGDTTKTKKAASPKKEETVSGAGATVKKTGRGGRK